MRGYFALGAEGISKTANFGAIMRTAHAFGASFVFSVSAVINADDLRTTDTSGGVDHLPYYDWPSMAEMALPAGCQLVGCELTDDATELPSFRHPLRAAYVFGPERNNLSPAMLARCDHVVKIPTRFCVNVSVAAAIVTYDRMISLGRFAERPVRVGGPRDAVPDHVHGRVRVRNRDNARMRPLLGEWE